MVDQSRVPERWPRRSSWPEVFSAIGHDLNVAGAIAAEWCLDGIPFEAEATPSVENVEVWNLG